MKKYHVYEARTEFRSNRKSLAEFAELIEDIGEETMRELIDKEDPESTSGEFIGEFDSYEDAVAAADSVTFFSTVFSVTGKVIAEVTVGDIHWPDDDEEWDENTDPSDICCWEFERRYPAFEV